ncbi:hypothetical protein PWT90_10685 [Aphanocladium album]|nr:hypothetical protein PWT90_10685 [Aphanocladium album]
MAIESAVCYGSTQTLQEYRAFVMPDTGCRCSLETRLLKFEPLKQNFHDIESPYTRRIFDSVPDKKQVDKSHDGADNKLGPVLDLRLQQAPSEIQALILDSLHDETLHALLKTYPLQSSRAKHVAVWRAAVRNEVDYAQLVMQTRVAGVAGDAFLAGIGVCHLSKRPVASGALHCLILSWTRDVEGLRINKNKFKHTDLARLMRPDVRLHVSPPLPVGQGEQMIRVSDLGMYLSKTNGELRIPILYLGRERYLLESATVTYSFTQHADPLSIEYPDAACTCHRYSFTAKGTTIVLMEDVADVPWHLRN